MLFLDLSLILSLHMTAYRLGWFTFDEIFFLFPSISNEFHKLDLAALFTLIFGSSGLFFLLFLF